MSKIEEKLKELGLTLPPVPAPGGVYKPVVISKGMIYVSGQLSTESDGSIITGRVGSDLSVDEGKNAARQSGLTMLATMKSQLGDLDRIKRLVKTLGMVNCEPGFEQQAMVINGYSELMVDLLGDDLGRGARSAVGMILPRNAATEIEAIWEINE